MTGVMCDMQCMTGMIYDMVIVECDRCAVQWLNVAGVMSTRHDDSV